MHMGRSRLARDDSHTLTQGGRGGHVDNAVWFHVDHAVIGRQNDAYAARQAPHEHCQARIKLLDLSDPRIGGHAVSMTRVVDLGPVQVDDGRPRAQLAQGRAHALLKGIGGHVARTAQCCARQAGPGEARGRHDR